MSWKPGPYDRGRTAFYACRNEQRVSYCLHVPKPVVEGGASGLIVAVHGSGRVASDYRDAFAALAEEKGAIVLAPLFPCGLIDADDHANYKLLAYGDIRFDLALNDMIDQVRERYRVSAPTCCLFGFSGGGQFVHRYYTLWPERLSAVSIGAPGNVTLLDPARTWWTGTGDSGQRFGRTVDTGRMAAVPCQMVVGADDTETWEITIKPGSAFWRPDANDAGATRIDRLRALESSYREAGIEVDFALVPGVAHQGFDVLDPVRSFFAKALAR